MALEQLRAFRSGQCLWDIGPIERILPPDNYPLLANSEVRPEHLEISKVLKEVSNGFACEGLKCSKTFAETCQRDDAARTRFALALIERTFAYDAQLSKPDDRSHSGFFGYGSATRAIAILWDLGVHKEEIAPAILEWFTQYRFNVYGTPALEIAVLWIIERYSAAELPDQLRERLKEVRNQLSDFDYHPSQVFISTSEKTRYLSCPEGKWLDFVIDEYLGRSSYSMLAACEHWAQKALEDLRDVKDPECWNELLALCAKAHSARPSAKWTKAGKAGIDRIGAGEFQARLLDWLPLVDRGRVRRTLGSVWLDIDESDRMHERNAITLRGLLWLSPFVASPELTRTVSSVAQSAYKKIRGLGPRAVKVGNAAVYALSQMGTFEAAGQLGILQAKVKFGTAQKEITKAFVAASEKLAIPADEISEIAVPAYGLTSVGIAEQTFGAFTARLSVTGTTSTDLVWVRDDGKLQKGVPAGVKDAFGEELKELKATAKDIARMLPAQSARIDIMFLQEKTWPLEIWRERYLDHPLVGFLARRLLWEFKSRERSLTGIWFNGKVVDLDSREIQLESEVLVRLWHPLGKPVEEVVAWREWLHTQQIQQPFKQAHREVYILTEAERRTRTYSNRYAAHVLKQHQFHALCALRGWKNKLRLLVDDEYLPATLHLPKWQLRAEFWIEGIGSDYGSDTNESGVFLRLNTDQVRFYRTGAAQRRAHAGGGGYHPGFFTPDTEPLPLEEVPPLVFSEAMRDVDMFVGVTSVGSDPEWSDGGPEGRYAAYWSAFSFGVLNGTAKTRKEVLERLVPRLKIAKHCSFEDRFLVVKGKLRSYKIHLGSGNILMTPNDQYLCIVPKLGMASEKVMLPFDGDRTLSVILSKAFLLAEDHKITDETIRRQIQI